MSEPEFLWRREIPRAETRELVIAVLKLDATCKIEKVESGPRLTAVTKPLARVRGLSFEGEKDIDEKNPKILLFHISKRRPSAVTLHFSARDFSTLHYSEIGEVTPNVTGSGAGGAFKTDIPSGVDDHTHDQGQGLTALAAVTEAPAHSHMISSKLFTPQGTVGGNGEAGIFVVPVGATVTGVTIPVPPPPLLPLIPPLAVTTVVTGLTEAPDIAAQVTGFAVDARGHGHSIFGKTGLVPGDAQPVHTHLLSLTAHPTGSQGATSVRGGNQLTFFKDLEITVDGLRVRDKILAQLQETNPSAWSLITSFDGTPGHPLVQGTGPIRLDLIEGLSFDPDEMRPHTIVFSVLGDGNGGCVQYNLYVE